MAGWLAVSQAFAHNGTPMPSSRTEGSSLVTGLGSAGSHNCVLNENGSLTCWGGNALGQVTGTPSGNDPVHTHVGPYLSFSANMHHTCAVRANGDINCWGNGAANKPGPFQAVATGRYHSCGLKVDGGVLCWGSNSEGAVGGTDGSNGVHPGPYLAVTGGRAHTCALRATGQVDCWGNNITGEVTGTPTSDGWSETWQLPSIRSHTHPGPYVALSASTNHSTTSHTCAIKADGNLDCWGYNHWGLSEDQSGAFASVSVGAYHNCAIEANGSMLCSGANGGGRFGYPASEPNSQVGVTIRHPGPYMSVASSHGSTCALKVNGGLQCWGNVPNTQSNIVATLGAPGSVGFGQITAGNAHACQVKVDGTLSCWGKDDEGQATAPAGLFTQVVAGDSHSCAINGTGAVQCWGRNGPGNTEGLNDRLQDLVGYQQLAPASNGAMCGLGSEASHCNRGLYAFSSQPQPLRNITSDLDLNPGLATVCGVSSKATEAGKGLCAVGYDANHGAYFAGPWRRLESGLKHQCGLKDNGSIECWGTALVDGQLNNAPASTERFRAFSVGWNHACAIRGDGTLKCWGSNVNGQATPPAGNHTYAQVVAGNTFTCAIRSNGVRACWGDDSHGQAPQLQVSPASAMMGFVGVAYSNSLSLVDAGQDADGDYVPPTPAFALVSGALPANLTLAANGTLSGTPTASGTFYFTVEGEDGNGFVARRDYALTISVDTTPPQISHTLTPATPDGDNGWYRTDVVLEWTVTDAESPVTLAGCVDATLNSNTPPAGATFSCGASSAGGSATPVSVTLKRDATAPSISVGPIVPANAQGWHKANVSVLVDCADATPSSGLPNCPSVPAITTETASHQVPAQTVFDNAGNSASSTAFTVKLDKTAPTISAAATTAPNGTNGWYTGNVSVAFTCADALSGVSSCPASQQFSAEGAAVSSTAQTAIDNADNVSAPSNVVTVKIDKTAPVLNPILPDPILRGQSYSANPNASDALSGVASQSCGVLDTSTLGSKSVNCTATNGAGLVGNAAVVYTVSTTCVNDGYTGTQLAWCQNICEMGYTGSTLDMWLRRWVDRYRNNLPYCRIAPAQPPA